MTPPIQEELPSERVEYLIPGISYSKLRLQDRTATQEKRDVKPQVKNFASFPALWADSDISQQKMARMMYSIFPCCWA
jgi:hypothetical protein